MVDAFYSLSHFVPGVARLFYRSGVLCMAALCVQLAGCASSANDRALTAGEQHRQSTTSSGQDSTGGHSASKTNGAGPEIAHDMARSLRNLLEQSSDVVPAIAVVAPVHPFDLHLIDGLQRAGFQVYLDKGQSAEHLLSYRLKTLPADSGSIGDARDYRLILVFDQWILSRDYRVQQEKVRALAPLEVIDDKSGPTDLVAGDLPASR